jgi:hypothetical protein
VLLSLVIVVVLLDPTRPLRFFPRLISFCFHAKFHPLFFMFEISLCLPRLARSTYLLLSPHRTYIAADIITTTTLSTPTYYWLVTRLSLSLTLS